jgi:exonuclease III
LRSDVYRVIHSGGDENQRGVAIIFDERAAHCITNIKYCIDRLMAVKVKATSVDLVVIQVYMPSSEHTEEEVDEIYEKIEDIMQDEKGNVHTIIMGEFNAVVGEGRDGMEIENYSLRKKMRGKDY